MSPLSVYEGDIQASPTSHLRNGNAALASDPQLAKSGASRTNRADCGAARPEPNQNGHKNGKNGATAKPGANGKNGAKVAPLPPGFLEAELAIHKRKLKTAEHVLQTCRHEIAELKGQLASMVTENRELREGNGALEDWKATQEEAHSRNLGSTRTAYWASVCVSILAVGAAAAVVFTRPRAAA
jgi:hypothetical protein